MGGIQENWGDDNVCIVAAVAILRSGNTAELNRILLFKGAQLTACKAHLRNGTAGKLIKPQEKRKKSKQKMAIEFFTWLSGDLIDLLKTVHSQCIKYDEFGFNTIFKKERKFIHKG